MRLKVARVREDAKLPTKAHGDDAAWDLYACQASHRMYYSYEGTVTIPTGISVEIPVGYVGLVLGRSGLASRGTLFNVGVIDPGYRGEIKVVLYAAPYTDISPGDRIAQLLIIRNEDIVLEEVEPNQLSETKRGTNGFGSTGR